ncbi:MAG: 2-methylcitrate dehydratase PrpD [Woeseiaceae bacterium]|jgi:2-methylcitrate dehydratase PrpD
MTLTQQLIRLIRDKGISDSDLQRAAFFTLDAIANALAGRNTDAGRKLVEWGRQQGRDAGRQAFVIGGLTHILETDDLHRSSVTHPGCVVVPAVIATVAQDNTSGQDILRAILHGYEAMCRVGNAVGPTHYQVWHNTATCGPYGSAMAMASLNGLADEQAMHALGNAGTQSSGVWEFLDTGAMSKHLHAGRAAESGMIAASLAALDFTGPPKILEGEKGFFAAACPDANPTAITAAADDAWELTQTSIKPWPCCRHTHPAIDAALELHGTFDETNIESVHVETYQAALNVCDRPVPESEYEAKFSLHHTVAVALLNGRVDFQSFSSDSRDSLAEFRQKVSVSAAEPWISAYPASWGARVTVKAGGAEYVAERDSAPGDPEHALDDDQMLDKAALLLAFAGCDRAEAKRIIAGVLALANGDATVTGSLRGLFR